MKILLWLTLVGAATLAVLLGVYVQIWIDDAWPMNIVFFGHRLSVFVALASGLCLLALAAALLSLWTDRRGGAVAAARPALPRLAVAARNPHPPLAPAAAPMSGGRRETKRTAA